MSPAPVDPVIISPTMPSAEMNQWGVLGGLMAEFP
jgi:hypothetical protein